MSVEDTLESLKSNATILIQNFSGSLYNTTPFDPNTRRFKHLDTLEQYEEVIQFITDLRNKDPHIYQDIYNKIHTLTKPEEKIDLETVHSTDNKNSANVFGPINLLIMYLVSESFAHSSFDKIDLTKQCKKINGEQVDIDINELNMVNVNMAVKKYHEIIKGININKLTMEVFVGTIIQTIITMQDRPLNYKNDSILSICQDLTAYKCMHSYIFDFIKELVVHNIDIEQYMMQYNVNELAGKMVTGIGKKNNLSKNGDEWKLIKHILEKWSHSNMRFDIYESTKTFIMLKTKVGFKLKISKHNNELYNVEMNGKIIQLKSEQIVEKYGIKKSDINILYIPNIDDIVTKKKYIKYPPGLPKQIPKPKSKPKNRKVQILPSISETNNDDNMIKEDMDDNHNVSNDDNKIKQNKCESNKNIEPLTNDSIEEEDPFDIFKVEIQVKDDLNNQITLLQKQFEKSQKQNKALNIKMNILKQANINLRQKIQNDNNHDNDDDNNDENETKNETKDKHDDNINDNDKDKYEQLTEENEIEEKQHVLKNNTKNDDIHKPIENKLISCSNPNCNVDNNLDFVTAQNDWTCVACKEKIIPSKEKLQFKLNTCENTNVNKMISTDTSNNSQEPIINNIKSKSAADNNEDLNAKVVKIKKEEKDVIIDNNSKVFLECDLQQLDLSTMRYPAFVEQSIWPILSDIINKIIEPFDSQKPKKFLSFCANSLSMQICDQSYKKFKRQYDEINIFNSELFTNTVKKDQLYIICGNNIKTHSKTYPFKMNRNSFMTANQICKTYQGIKTKSLPKSLRTRKCFESNDAYISQNMFVNLQNVSCLKCKNISDVEEIIKQIKLKSFVELCTYKLLKMIIINKQQQKYFIRDGLVIKLQLDNDNVDVVVEFDDIHPINIWTDSYDIKRKLKLYNPTCDVDQEYKYIQKNNTQLPPVVRLINDVSKSNQLTIPSTSLPLLNTNVLPTISNNNYNAFNTLSQSINLNNNNNNIMNIPSNPQSININHNLNNNPMNNTFVQPPSQSFMYPQPLYTLPQLMNLNNNIMNIPSYLQSININHNLNNNPMNYTFGAQQNNNNNNNNNNMFQ